MNPAAVPTRDLPPAPHAMIPWLQAAALVSFLFTPLQFVNPEVLDVAAAPLLDRTRGILVASLLTACVLLAVLWLVRSRLHSTRARLVLSCVAFALIALAVQVGQIGMSAPVLILGIMFIVIDATWIVGMMVSALFFVVTLAIGTFVFGAPMLFVVVNALPLAVISVVGVFLGVLLTRYERTLDIQQTLVEERDAALIDITTRATTEKELILAKERARAASELHDGLGHRLTHIAMSLEFAQRMRERDPESAWAEVDGAREASLTAMTDMRTWVRALSPVRSTHARGIDALDEIASSFRNTGLNVQVHNSVGPVDLSDDMEQLMYRTVQEGLTNALRHSDASSVNIWVSQSHGSMFVGLTNPTGTGNATDRDSTVSTATLLPGVGLMGLTERAEALGGTLHAGHEESDGVPTFVLRIDIPKAAAFPRTEVAG